MRLKAMSNIREESYLGDGHVRRILQVCASEEGNLLGTGLAEDDQIRGPKMWPAPLFHVGVSTS